ncbi:PKD domain-containing protein [Halorussus sp. MSC15.2]|uniref:COG1470 family protein n=1 Tax=Halorussus sp. MSC15.2 TaxID=2283638 RepID=UPI0013D7B366|nr:PKD domain-containing protein [Halorussus sp. MSC15.2]NEU56905.1 PKD domain-containing protein [Halorussus sp. MSC15.2]
MTRTRTRLAIVGIALLSVAAAVPLPPSAGTAAAAEHTFVVEQGSQCYEVSPLDGSEGVASFYDYRNIENDGGDDQYTYSSYMPRNLPQEDTSRLFLYDGPDGVSLVMVHNALGGDEGDGSAATFRFRGLPSGGNWVVEDDDYARQDDRFSRDRIDWSWYGDRTDGAVFRGLDRDGTEVTVVPAFDEQAALYDSPVDRSGDTRAWQFLTGSVGDPSAVGLDMNDPVTIRTGYCGPDESAPNAALSGEDGVAGYPVGFNASDSSDNRGVAEYRWDFDGDGEVERTTDDPTVTREFAAAGTYNATVTVVDAAGNADRERVSVSVESDDPPSAAFRTGDSPTQGFPVTFDARNASDDVGVTEYRWDFDGDGAVERNTTDPTVTRTYDEAGDYEVGLTVVDGGGNNATTTRTVSVSEDSPPDPAIRVASPATPVEGEQVVLDAGNSTDDTGIAEYRWSLAGNATATGERVAYTFDGNGTFPVTLEVVDEGGNNATATTEIEVLPPDETAPNATVSANASRTEAGGVVGLDASGSDDDRGVSEYRWDFDGDGETDEVTANPTVERAYGSTGTYDATVTVVDNGGNAASDNVTVRVFPEDGTAPTARLSVAANTTETDAAVTFDASNASDGQTTITEYRWDFDGDGETDEVTTDATVEHAYGSAGTYNATVAVVDFGNNTANATVRMEVEPAEQAHSSGGGGGGGGSTSLGPPPVVTETQKRGPNAGVVDVRNARGDETVRADLPAAAAAEKTGVAFRSMAVNLAGDDPHFAVETSRSGERIADPALPADVALGSLSVGANYVRSEQIERVTYEVVVERSRLADAGLAPADLTAYRRAGDAWERTNATVTSRRETVVLRVETDALSSIAVGGERSVTVADAELGATRVAADEPVSVTATLRNEGESAAEFAANLTADGEVAATETVTVPAGETKRIIVEATLAPGRHRIALGQTRVGNVTVAEPTADIGVADVSLNSSTVSAGGRVEITATVENTGSEAGERAVALTLFGQQVANEAVRVPAHDTAEVTFVREVEAAGNYTATVGNTSATLEVVGDDGSGGDGDGQTAPRVPVSGFGVGAAVAALLGAALLAARNRG